MIHAVAYVVFILLFTAWLGQELQKNYSLKKYWHWVAGAFVVGIVGSTYNGAHLDLAGNFVLHASGGVSATLLFVYLVTTLKLSFYNWRITLFVLFAWVSALGVLNELAEYFFELLGVDIFSYDTHDTWRDLTANTIGMLLMWSALMIFTKILTGKKQR
jgi:hypothetical protein